MTKNIILLVAVILLVAPLHASAGDYTMDDLRALQKDGYWEELLNNAKSIKPTERNDEWKSLVSNAAVNYLAQKEDGYVGYAATNLMDEYPFLKQDSRFSTSAGDSLFSSLHECIENTDPTWGYNSCLEEYKDTAGQSVAPETAMRVARYLKPYLLPSTVSPYYEFAVKDDNAYCSDAGLQESVLEGLTGPSYNDESKSARNIAFKLCKNEMAGAVESAKAKESANYTQRTRHFMKNYCTFHDTEECRKADF